MAKSLRFLTSALLACTLILAGLTCAAADDEFKILFIGQRTIDNQNTIAVTFSAKVDGTQDINRYLALVSEDEGLVEGAWALTAKGDVAYFTNIEADHKYTVEIRKGLKAADGLPLYEAKQKKVKTRPAKAFISFGGKGYLLPNELAEGLPVNTMNVKAADIDFFRVKEKYMVEFISMMQNKAELPYYYGDDVKRYTDLVYSARFDMDAPKNIMTKAILPLRNIKELEKSGLYLAMLRQAGTYPYNTSATYFSISNIGLHLRAYDQSMEVQVNALTSGKPYINAKLTTYDKKGKILERTVSNKVGRAIFRKSRKKAHLLVASHEGNTSILPLRGPALDLSAFDLGKQPYRDIELFVYGPRDLYRPGETVVMDALLRNFDGKTIASTAPIRVSIKQPDGRQAKSFVWHGQSLNAFHYKYDLPAGAQTGTWSAEFKLAKKVIQLYKFKVEDFMPERMKLTLDNGDVDPKRISAKETIKMPVQGDYLYGAPAAGNRVDCHVRMTLARELIKKLPGFEFGHIDEKIGRSFQTDDIKLDKNGKGVIKVPNQWAKVGSPLKIRLHTSLYESGGRPVSRNKIYYMWPAKQLIGVRPLWEGKQPNADSLVEFEVVKADFDGKLFQAKNLEVTVIREYPDYYWEYNSSTGWERIVNYQHYPVIRTKLDLTDKKPAKLSFPVEWGPYRLEIRDPKTDRTTAYRFSAGWSWHGSGAGQQGSRPDQVVLTLDKPSYKAGDTARVLIKAPEAGTALVSVESDQPLWRTIVDVKAKGTEVKIPVSADWARHDLHVSVMVIRPGDRKKKIAPKRALGLIHLPLDRTDRQMEVSIDAPEKTLPNTKMKVGLQVKGAKGAGEVYVTLAAVDVGVLSITDFETPDPAGYFFNRRRYGVNHYDLYQKIIEASEGEMARKRYGGDAAAITRGGDKPVTDVQIVSIYKKRMLVDEQGRAEVVLDLPDFNGRVRLMAVAYSDSTYGQGEQEVTIAAPVVAEIAMPRFLAMNDQAFLALDVQNLSGLPQELKVSLKAGNPIELIDKGTQKLSLADKQKVTLRYAVQAKPIVGLGNIDLNIEGIRPEKGAKPIAIKRQWRLGTRPAYPAITRHWRKSLEPGQTLEIKPDVLKNLLSQTVHGDLTLSSHPPIDVARHVRQLFAYPYGCLEQTTSGIYPQVFLNRSDIDILGIKTQHEKVRRQKVAKGIDRLLSLQKPNGGFGLWSDSSPEECWLTAYVTDFLITARDQGYEVPEEALNKALKRLRTYLQKSRTVKVRYSSNKKHARFAVQAYSAYVLARLNRAPLGSMRTLMDYHAKHSRSGLPLVHLGIALQQKGDKRRAKKAFSMAVNIADDENRRYYYGDYGSPLRDAAMAYTLLSTHTRQKAQAGAWLIKLDANLQKREWLSTQERNALVLAGVQMLRSEGQAWKAHLDYGSDKDNLTGTGMLIQNYDYDKLAKGLTITAKGETSLYVNFVMSGYSDKPPEAEGHVVEIHRSYYDLKGKPTKISNLKTGDLVLVRLDISTEQRVSEGLVVDLIPAGLELENQNLATSFNIDDIKVEGKTLRKWKRKIRLAHEEYRDDRYVAAIDINHYRPITLFYLARAVTPGLYQVPNAYVEDMYRPYIRSIGEKRGLLKIEQPKQKP